MSHQLSATCTSRLRNTSGTIAGLRASANTPTLAAARNGRPPPGPPHELYSGSVSRRCCFSEGMLSTGVSSSVTRDSMSTLTGGAARAAATPAACTEAARATLKAGLVSTRPGRAGSAPEALDCGSSAGMTAVGGGRLHALTSIHRVSGNCGVDLQATAVSRSRGRGVGPTRRCGWIVGVADTTRRDPGAAAGVRASQSPDPHRVEVRGRGVCSGIRDPGRNRV